MMKEYRGFMRWFVQRFVIGRSRLRHPTRDGTGPYSRNPSEKPLGGFCWRSLQQVRGTLGKFLLDSPPTLRRQLGDSTVNAFLEINGYESIM